MTQDYSQLKEPLRSICDGSRKFTESKRIAFEPACQQALYDLRVASINSVNNQPVQNNQPPPEPEKPMLGDMLSKALSAVGITEERVSTWLGRPCGCGERKQKLNSLHAWFLGDKSVPPTMD